MKLGPVLDRELVASNLNRATCTDRLNQGCFHISAILLHPKIPAGFDRCNSLSNHLECRSFHYLLLCLLWVVLLWNSRRVQDEYREEAVEHEKGRHSFRARAHAPSLRARIDPIHYWTDACGRLGSDPLGTVQHLRRPTIQRLLVEGREKPTITVLSKSKE